MAAAAAGAAAALLARACSVAGARSSSQGRSGLRRAGRVLEPRRWQTAAAAAAQPLEPTTTGTTATRPAEVLSDLEGFVQRARRRLLARQGAGSAGTIVGVAGSLAAPAAEPWTTMDEAWLAALKRHLAAPNEHPTDRTRTAVVTRLLGYSDAYQYALLPATLSALTTASGSRRTGARWPMPALARLLVDLGVYAPLANPHALNSRPQFEPHVLAAADSLYRGPYEPHGAGPGASGLTERTRRHGSLTARRVHQRPA